MLQGNVMCFLRKSLRDFEIKSLFLFFVNPPIYQSICHFHFPCLSMRILHTGPSIEMNLMRRSTVIIKGRLGLPKLLYF